MLSIVIAVIIARQYLAAAATFRKKKWLWGTIGVAVFIGSHLLLVLALGLFMALKGTEEIQGEFIWDIIGMVAGFGIAYGVLELMKKNARKEKTSHNQDLLDQFDEAE
ncbi:MAG: hypothetical protein ACI80P_001365 [Flavobacteriales bacterium]|jgi:hypothetical protein